MGHGSQKRRICFEYDSIKRNIGDGLGHPSILECQRAAYADMEAEVHHGPSELGRAAEAVEYAEQPLPGRRRRLFLTQNLNEIVRRGRLILLVAVVKDERQILLHSQPRVETQHILLFGDVGLVPVVIEAAFTDRYEARIIAEGLDFSEVGVRRILRFRWMERRHCVKALKPLAQRKRLMD